MTTLSDLLQCNLLDISSQRDRKKRRAALKELWAPDGVMWSAEGTYLGLRAIEESAANLLRRYPEFAFTAVGEVDEIPDAARMRWSFGAAGTPPAITGMDVVVASNGRIVSLYRFLDGAEM